MSDKNGPRRDRPLSLRDLNGEDATARYKRLGWDPRKTYEENMGYENLFIDDGSLEEPDLEPAPRRRKPSRAVRDLGAEGRGEDTEIAHLTPGELVVPRALQTPEFTAALESAAATHGVPLDMLKIGNRMNRINPNTGAPEFGLLSGFGDWLSRTFGMGTANAAETPGSGPAQAGAEQGLGQQQPYRYEGPEVEEITVTGKPSTIPSTVFPNQQAFFEKLSEPATRMAEKYGLNPEDVLGLAALEGKWFADPYAIANNNPFGVNYPGTNQLRKFENLDEAFDYWGKVFGEQIRDKYKTDDFIDGLQNSLRAGAYNSVIKDYDTRLRDTIHSVNVKKYYWNQKGQKRGFPQS